MKKSTEIFTELQTVLATIRDLNAEVERCQPIRKNWRLSPAENKENDSRRRRFDEITIELRKANAEAVVLRKRYSDAMATEQAPLLASAEPLKSIGEIPKLRKQIAEAEASLADLPEQRRPHVVAAARGEKKAIAALDQIAAAENSALSKIDIAKAAISEIEAQNAETQREFAERDADEKHRAGLLAADEIVAWAEKFDNLLGYVAAHFAKLPDLQKALAKSGADINTDLTNRIYTPASRDRAAKAAHLHRVFSIDATVAAMPLGEAFRSLMRAAVRRPNVKDKAA